MNITPLRKRIPPQAAPKSVPSLDRITPRKIAIARAFALTNKDPEVLAMIYNLTPRQVRRKIDQVKAWMGVHCVTELAHKFHAYGMGFTCPKEQSDYIEQDQRLRK